MDGRPDGWRWAGGVGREVGRLTGRRARGMVEGRGGAELGAWVRGGDNVTAPNGQERQDGHKDSLQRTPNKDLFGVSLRCSIGRAAGGAHRSRELGAEPLVDGPVHVLHLHRAHGCARRRARARLLLPGDVWARDCVVASCGRPNRLGVLPARYDAPLRGKGGAPRCPWRPGRATPADFEEL